MHEDEVAPAPLAAALPPALRLVHLPDRVEEPAPAVLDALLNLGLLELHLVRVDDLGGVVGLVPCLAVAEGAEEDAAEGVAHAGRGHEALGGGMVGEEVAAVGGIGDGVAPGGDEVGLGELPEGQMRNWRAGGRSNVPEGVVEGHDYRCLRDGDGDGGVWGQGLV